MIQTVLVTASARVTASTAIWEVVRQSVLGDPPPRAPIIHKSLEKAEIIPDGNKIKPKAVSSSPDLFVHAFREHDGPNPSPTTRSNVTYTLVLTDPDATSHSNPVKAEMCHWIVTGISLNANPADRVLWPGAHRDTEAIADTVDLSAAKPQMYENGSNAEELMPYLAPTPPPGTGFHRYVFVMLAPKTDKDAETAKSLKKPKERPHWGYGKAGKGIRDWAADNGLTPVGANFFFAKHKRQ
ncbi:MAG: hypothetical protein Q9219_006534 [cf. Caloplaca sp. 3 TL-2023]